MTLKAENLDHFCGAQEWFKYPSPYVKDLYYTEGIDYLCRKGGAWWLLDQICSYQNALKTHGQLRYMQFWKLRVNGTEGLLTCVADSDVPPTIKLKIPYTNFPLPGVKIWVERGSCIYNGQVAEGMIAMLPGER